MGILPHLKHLPLTDLATYVVVQGVSRISSLDYSTSCRCSVPLAPANGNSPEVQRILSEVVRLLNNTGFIHANYGDGSVELSVTSTKRGGLDLKQIIATLRDQSNPSSDKGLNPHGSLKLSHVEMLELARRRTEERKRGNNSGHQL